MSDLYRELMRLTPAQYTALAAWIVVQGVSIGLAIDLVCRRARELRSKE